MKSVFVQLSTSSIVLACLVAPATVDAGIKPPKAERTMPLTVFEPPGFHTNQGGRSAGGGDPFKPGAGEMTLIPLFELLISQSSFSTDFNKVMLTPVLESSDSLQGSVFTIRPKPDVYIGFETQRDEGVSPTPLPGQTGALVPAPGALVLLLGGSLGATRRRRRRD